MTSPDPDQLTLDEPEDEDDGSFGWWVLQQRAENLDNLIATTQAEA